MIILQEKHDDVNIVHLIIGPESQFQLNMAGHIMTDISGTIDPDIKNFLVLNRCESEEELQKKLVEIQSKMRSNPQEDQNSHGHNAHPSITKIVKCPKCKSGNSEVKNGKVQLCESCQKIEKGLVKNENRGLLKMPINERIQIIKELTKDDKEFKAIVKKYFIDKVKREIKNEQ